VSAPDFVAIGHVTLDRFGGPVRDRAHRLRPGGAALYAAVTAHRLGLSVGLLTSHADDFPLDLIPPAIEVVTVPAGDTTTFEHRTDEEGRTLLVHATANPISAAHLPDDWADATIVLLAPVAAEVDPQLASRFADATVGAAMQGWLRRSGEDDVVTPAAWYPPAWLLDRVAALFMSVDDVQGLEDDVTEWLQRVPVAVLTAGRTGALLYVSGDRYEIPALPTEEVDPTGAGDVFAATFLVRHHAGDDPWEAARAAACAAAMSVCGEGFSSVPTARGLASALADYRRLRDAAP
jgi:sugar/nucleoside kinase (ribokinase family)